MKKIKKISFLLISIFVLYSCAKRGNITGGDKDIVAPKIVSSNPENFQSNFDKNTIKINFNEYIKIKDLQKELIVSPPMKNPIVVLPQGSASKFINIKINDTLQKNTTYSFNFGQSIVDYNEENPFNQFKYVFSTGAFIDSLSIEGTIKDSYERNTDSYINVMLYEVNEKYTDSTVFKEIPRYITNTLDSLKTFKIENLKAGKYKLVALKEKTNNYKFDPSKDKIGFYNQVITVPDKSIFELEMFKEKTAFKIKKPTQASGNKILVGYEGTSDKINVLVKKRGAKVDHLLTKFPEKDSLQVWFPTIKNDSLQLEINNSNYTVSIGNQKQDSLKIKPVSSTILGLNDVFKINSSTPLTKFDLTKIRLTKKDSSLVDFKIKYDDFNQNLEIIFIKEADENYFFKAYPNAFEDYLGQKNDSVNFKFSTKKPDDYGNLKINLLNTKSFPIIVELTDKNGLVLSSLYTEKENSVEFLLLDPKKYFVRIIYDSNKNKERDTGSFLQNLQAEEVVHYPTEIDVRANWDVNQDFDLSK